MRSTRLLTSAGSTQTTKINEIISFFKRQKRQRSSVWKHCRLRKIINPNRFLRLYFSPFSGMLYKPLITLNFMLQRQGALFGFVILRGIIPRSYIFLYHPSLFIRVCIDGCYYFTFIQHIIILSALTFFGVIVLFFALVNLFYLA